MQDRCILTITLEELYGTDLGTEVTGVHIREELIEYRLLSSFQGIPLAAFGPLIEWVVMARRGRRIPHCTGAAGRAGLSGLLQLVQHPPIAAR